VLLTTAPTGSSATRLAAILTVGARLSIAGLLLGAWDAGQTWHVHADGRTQRGETANAAQTRLNVLSPAAATEILDIVRQAHPAEAMPADESALRLPTPRQPPPGAEPRPHPTTRHTPQGPTAPPSLPSPDTATRLRVTVLGKPQVQAVTVGTATDVRIRRSDGIQILVFLAANPGGATSDELMEILWPEVRRHSARGRFHTTISELRHTLAEVTGTDAIVRTGERYHLEPDHVEVDLWELHAAVDHAATTLDAGDHPATLRTVIQRYTGPIAEGHSWIWLAPYQETIRRHLLDAYVTLADRADSADAALALVQDAIRLDPYNEDIYQHAMRLHAATDNPDGVRRSLRALTQRLSELDITPTPQTQQIATELLAQIQARTRVRDSADL
jgi:DNA-binding SARP family transcriptional activator